MLIISSLLKELVPVYGGRTLENIIQGLEARIKECEGQVLKKAVESGDEAAMVGFPEFGELLDENDLI